MLTLLSIVKYDLDMFSKFRAFSEYLNFNIIIICALDDIWQNRQYCLVQYSTEKNEEEGCKVLWVLARCPQFVPLYIDIETDGNGSVYLPSYFHYYVQVCCTFVYPVLVVIVTGIYITRNIFSKIPLHEFLCL